MEPNPGQFNSNSQTNNIMPSAVAPKQKASAKDFFLNLGAIVALYTTVFTLINLLFTVINKAYPQITNGYYYSSSSSISWPVAMLIVFFPIYVLLMWLLERDYVAQPEKKHVSVRKWLTYITLFIAGLTLAGDLVTVLYYFIDGQELTIGFLLKVVVVLVIAAGVFMYYITDIRDKMTASSRKMWLIVAILVIVGSVVWGFSVLGSPRTQQLLKYDEQKVNDLMNINNEVSSYWYSKNVLPTTLADLATTQDYFTVPVDQQTGAPYEYKKTGNNTYQLCATFNKTSADQNVGSQTRPVQYGGDVWTHPAGHYCFSETVTANQNYPKGIPAPVPAY